MEYKTNSVHVICMTFNHVNYITDTMNSFCMQETSFPFVCTIIDDASTDGEQEVIKGYFLEHFDIENKYVRNEETDDYVLTFAQHKENKNCYFAVLCLKYNHYSIGKNHQKYEYVKEWSDNCKYIAFCEGDDYWTHPKKLQLQFDALEAHPNCTICFGRTERISKNGMQYGSFIPHDVSRINNIVTLEDFCREQFTVGQWTFHTSSFFFTQKVLYNFNAQKSGPFKEFPYGDICVILSGLLAGNGIYIDIKMSNYRILSGGFNSNMKNNSLQAIKVEEQLVKGMNDFDRYTNFKYHKHIENRLLRSHCLIDYRKEGNNGLVFLRPKYWKIAKMQGLKTTSLMILQTIIPGPYYFLRKLLKGR